MAKTLLEYVQSSLSAMESDQVDTINDTLEAMDHANLLKEVYYEVLARQDWPFMRRPLTLDAAADPTQPTSFTIPDAVKLIEELAYNISETGSYKRGCLEYVEPGCFVRQVQASEDATNAQLVELGDSIKVWVATDRMPRIWTSFDDVTVVMDAVDQDIESTLQTAKLQGFGIVLPDFTIEDDFVPTIPYNMEPLLQAELTRRAFKLWKQIESTSDEEIAKRQLARGRREASKVDRPANIWYRNRFGRPSARG